MVHNAVRSRAGLLAVSGGALLWGTTGVPVRIIGERSGLSAVPIGCLRLIIAALVIAALFGRGGWRRTRVAFAHHRWWLVAAGAGLGSYQALYFVGIQYVGVSVSTLVSLAFAPILLTGWAAVTQRRLPGAFTTFTLVAAVGGLVLISIGPGPSSGADRPALGLAASFAAGLGYAGTTLVNKRIAHRGDPMLLTGATSAIGAVVLVPFALIAGLRWPADGIATGWLVYIGVATTAVAYGLFYLGLRTTSPETVGVVTLLEPLAATILAAVVLHERLTTLGVVGGVLMLVSIAGLYLRAAPADFD